MEQEIAKNIIKKLLELTKSDKINWNLVKNTLQTYNFQYQSELDQTRFTIEITINTEQKFPSHNAWWLYIYDKNLIDGKYSAYSGNISYVTDLANQIYWKYIQPNLKPIDQSVALNNILNGLDLQNIRDSKIQKIID